MRETLQSSAAVARFCAEILDEFKMEEIKIFDVSSALQVADYFVIASGSNERQVRAAGDELLKRLRESGAKRRGLEGYREGKWVLMDYSDVVVHLFLRECRLYYDLENLWGDCPRLEWASGARGAEAPVLAGRSLEGR